MARTSRGVVRPEKRTQRPGGHPDDGTGRVQMAGRIVVHQPHHPRRAQTQAWRRTPRQALPSRRTQEMDRERWTNGASYRRTDDERRNEKDQRSRGLTSIVIRGVSWHRIFVSRSRAHVVWHVSVVVWHVSVVVSHVSRLVRNVELELEHGHFPLTSRNHRLPCWGYFFAKMGPTNSRSL